MKYNLQIEIDSQDGIRWEEWTKEMGFDSLTDYMERKVQKELPDDILDDHCEWKAGNQNLIFYLNWLLK